MVEMGSRAQDTITGFEGIVIARSEFLYGCTRVFIEPEHLDKDGKHIEGNWYDEQRVQVIDRDVTRISKDYEPPLGRTGSGGPQRDATRAPDATR